MSDYADPQEMQHTIGRFAADLSTLLMEKECRIEQLEEIIRNVDTVRDRDRIKELESLVTDAFKIFDKYLNVPEAHELRERWAKLKAL